jgi:hypothetical protein
MKGFVKALVQTLAWLVVLLLLPVGMLYLTARPVVVAGCPQCFGFSKTADGVYLQSGMPDAARAHAEQLLASAAKRAADFYGSLEHRPRLLVCGDDACYTRVGGMQGTASGSVASFAVLVSPRGLDPVVISAALSHAELGGRVGFWHMKSGAIPAWFDAGVAALVSDDPAYVLPRPTQHKDRCLTGPGGDLPEAEDVWQQQTQTLYYLNAVAACRVDLWMIAHGGPAGVTGLLDKLGQGQDFATLFPPQ